MKLRFYLSVWFYPGRAINDCPCAGRRLQLREVRETANDVRQARDEAERSLADSRGQVAELRGRVVELHAQVTDLNSQLTAARGGGGDTATVDLVEGHKLRDAEAQLREVQVCPIGWRAAQLVRPEDPAARIFVMIDWRCLAPTIALLSCANNVLGLAVLLLDVTPLVALRVSSKPYKV